MIRLRKALNSRNKECTGSLDWLDKHRKGNRFYFGRYTGATPVSGDRNSTSVKNRLREEKKGYIKDWESVKDETKNSDNSELVYHIPCMEQDSAEMWDRISMQENAPDILITNYSMLNIMLMRKAEDNIFEQTRQWLAESKNNVFHLIVDELHTYRGTAGTEVSYLLKVLLDRIGLAPDSPQVQFLASSASMEDNEQTKDYLCEFFGISEQTYKSKFKIISDLPQEEVSKPNIDLPTEPLLHYADKSISEEDRRNILFQELKCHSFIDITQKYHIDDWLKFGVSINGKILAQDIYSQPLKRG